MNDNLLIDDEIIFRTEDLKLKEIGTKFVETKKDRENIEYLKKKTPIILSGSRGTGKTMLLKMAEKEMDDSYEKNKVLPVFISFSKAIFVDIDKDILFFKQWMLSKILFELRVKLRKHGIGMSQPSIFGSLFGCSDEVDELSDKLNSFITVMEETWRKKDDESNERLRQVFGIEPERIGVISDVDYFKKLIEELCEYYDIERVVLLFDEACHNFIPIQQREFFTFFRDLRTPYISCKAAVYPGITSYGTFQAFHDAEIRKIERDISDKDYIANMREMVKNQLGEDVYKIFESNGDNFNALIYAASGNPRLMLKNIYAASNELKSLNVLNTNNTIKQFYRTNIWNEHTKLGEIYTGYKPLIDWGRDFIENKVLEETYNKNEKRLGSDDYSQTIFFAINRNAPEAVKKAMKILEYSGIVTLHTEGTKVRTEILDRYQLNFGIVLASESKDTPVKRYKEIVEHLSVKLYTEYGENSPAYGNVTGIVLNGNNEKSSSVLASILDSKIEKLDLTRFQMETLKNSGFVTVGDVLRGNENDLQRAYGIGPVRARRIFNIIFNASIEYISG
jgi:hypothetical protein